MLWPLPVLRQPEPYYELWWNRWYALYHLEAMRLLSDFISALFEHGCEP